MKLRARRTCKQRLVYLWQDRYLLLVAVIVGIIFGWLFVQAIPAAPQEGPVADDPGVLTHSEPNASVADPVAEKYARWTSLQEAASLAAAFDEWVERHDADLQTCRVTFYHPREASNWKRWANCRHLGDRDRVPGPGAKVRPGVCCVSAKSWRRWEGKLLWVRGHGLFQVLDADSYRGGTYWFDLATGSPWTYDDWLWDDDAVRRARRGPTQQRGVEFVVLEDWPDLAKEEQWPTTPTDPTGGD